MIATDAPDPGSPGGPGLLAPRRVLIIKPSALGDVVTALPVLRGLRRSLPEAHLAWLVSTACAPLIAGDRDLDEIIGFDRRRLGQAWRSPRAAVALARFLRRLRAGRFDWVVDLQGLLRSGLFAAATAAPLRAGFAAAREGAGVFYTHRFVAAGPHTVDRNVDLARQLGIDARGEDMTLDVSPAGRAFAEEFCRRRGITRGGFVVCAPPTRWETKMYPVRHWRSVIGALAEEFPVAVIGAPSERGICARIVADMPAAVTNLAGRTSLPEMAGLIAASGVCVCSDSAAQFIAPAVGVNVISLVGPTRPARTGPYLAGPRRAGASRAIVANVPCQGCLKRRCRHVTCMQTIDPAEVVAAARSAASSRSNRAMVDGRAR